MDLLVNALTDFYISDDRWIVAENMNVGIDDAHIVVTSIGFVYLYKNTYLKYNFKVYIILLITMIIEVEFVKFGPLHKITERLRLEGSHVWVAEAPKNIISSL